MPAPVILVYAAATYLLFLAVLGYAVDFFADAGVPKGIDQGPHAAVPVAAGIDVLLLLLFAVQHTVMARPWFKRRWARVVPAPAERSTYVLAASLALVLLFWLWRPIAGTAWRLPERGAAVVWAGYAAGWAVAVSSTFLISHADMFGLRQAWLHARRAAYSPPPFTERGLYRRIRHPLMAGFLIIFWSVPTMTAGHLLFAITATGYILAGIAFEEHDLRQSLGETYAAYRARVPALFPRLSNRHPATTGPSPTRRPGRLCRPGPGDHRREPAPQPTARDGPPEAQIVLDQLAAYGTRDQVREQLQLSDQAADIVTILLPPGLPWPAIEATLRATAPGTALQTSPGDPPSPGRPRRFSRPAGIPGAGWCRRP